MAKRKREYDDDDGRVIADMNVDGMPWYSPKPNFPGEPKAEGKAPRDQEPLKLTREEKRAIYGGALKAGLVLCLILGGAYALFILFCQFVWFK